MTKKQILFIVSIAIAFLLFDMGIYFTFTVRYKNSPGETSQREAIAPEKYLPFDENSLIAKIDTDFSISGELPVLDGPFTRLWRTQFIQRTAVFLTAKTLPPKAQYSTEIL